MFMTLSIVEVTPTQPGGIARREKKFASFVPPMASGY
jgi:hypothetical protein